MRCGVAGQFEAAHHLVGAGLCEQTHGHTYDVEAVAEVDPARADAFRDAVRGACRAWDHSDLNRMMEYPSAENLAAGLFVVVRRDWPGLVSVRVYEGLGKWAEANADDPTFKA